MITSVVLNYKYSRRPYKFRPLIAIARRANYRLQYYNNNILWWLSRKVTRNYVNPRPPRKLQSRASRSPRARKPAD